MTILKKKIPLEICKSKSYRVRDYFKRFHWKLIEKKSQTVCRKTRGYCQQPGCSQFYEYKPSGSTTHSNKHLVKVHKISTDSKSVDEKLEASEDQLALIRINGYVYHNGWPFLSNYRKYIFIWTYNRILQL